MAPSVSVVIPTYNRARIVTRAIESALSQTRPAKEILVVDDGSLDDTRERVEPYLLEPRVRYLRQENQGVAAARNHAIRIASGELIAFLDSDDEWLPDKLAKQVPAFDDPEVGAAYCDMEVISESGEKRESFIEGNGAGSGRIFGLLLKNCFIVPSTVVVRRSCLMEVGCFDEELVAVEDLDLWLRLARRYRIELVREPLVRFHRLSDGMSGDVRAMSEGLIDVFMKWLPEDRGLTPEETASIRHGLSARYFELAMAVREESRLEALAHIRRSLRFNYRNRLAWKCLLGLMRRSLVGS